MVCQGRQPGRAVPSLPTRFYYRLEVIYTDIETIQFEDVCMKYYNKFWSNILFMKNTFPNCYWNHYIDWPRPTCCHNLNFVEVLELLDNTDVEYMSIIYKKDYLIRETNSCKNTVFCPLGEWFMYFNVLQRPPCHERPIYAFMWWVLLNGQWINSFHNLFFRYGTTKRWNYTGEIISPWFQSIQAIPKILSLKFTIIIPVGCNFAQNNYERITTK